jgi:NADH-quinone oxidoreductase subunit C
VPVEEAAAPGIEPDAACSQLLAKLQTQLGGDLLGSAIQRRELTIRIPLSRWVETATFCRDSLGLRYFCFLSGLDWLDNPAQTTRYENVWGSVDEDDDAAEGDAEASDAEATGEKSSGETSPASEEAPAADATAASAAPPGFAPGLTGGDSRFQVFARYFDVGSRRAVVVKADVDDADPSVPTISGVFAGADWHERETWEMYGFWFEGHPNLVHIYLPGAFEGYPLRKDFPLLAREVKPWPGLTNVEPIAGAADEEGES